MTPKKGPSVFVGRDRRRAPQYVGLGRVFLVGATTVLGAAVLLASVAVSSDSIDPHTAHDLRLVLDAASTVLAIGVFAFCVARWRLVGESAPLWAGTAALVLGVATVGVPNVVQPLASGLPAGHSPLRDAGLVATLLLLAAALLAPTVDTRLRPRSLVLAVAGAVAVVTGVFGVWPEVGHALTVSGIGAPPLVVTVTGIVVAGGWLAVACGFALKSLQRQWLYGWCGVLAFALLLAQVADAAAPSNGPSWAVVAAALRALGLLVAAAGCAFELAGAYIDQRSRLFDSELTLEAAAVQERLEAANLRTKRHDVANAVVAIEGAAVTLERHLERLSERDRASLTHVLSSGVERLQRLLEDGRGLETVELGDVAAAVVRDLGWDERVALHVPSGLVGTGSETQTAEVVRLLLDNADQRAPGEVVTVSGGRDGDWVVLRVQDHGPDLSRQRRRVLHSNSNQGVLATQAGRQPLEGGEISLLVAGRLMQDQGGDVWVETLAGGGTAFAVCLPARPTADGQQEAGAGGA